jgi:acetyltransferase-like isoleucine patch superfamily enzyme
MFIHDPEMLISKEKTGSGRSAEPGLAGRSAEPSYSGSPAWFHPAALVESDQIGAGTRIWAFAHVAAGAVVGADCNICDHTFLEKGSVIGDRVTLKCGVYLWDGVLIEDDVFIGPNVSFCNDPYPRSKVHLAVHPRTVIRRGASIGSGAVILPGVEIGAYAMVGAGAVVTQTIPAFALAYGNPARVQGRVDRHGQPIRSSANVWVPRVA